MTLMQINVNSACMNRSLIISYGNEWYKLITRTASSLKISSRDILLLHKEEVWSKEQLFP
jgi:hypothetical protein